MALAFPSAAADPPVKLIVKPLLCVVDKGATTCAVTFDIRWKSMLPARVLPQRQRADHPAALLAQRVSGEHQHSAKFSEDFMLLAVARPLATERLSRGENRGVARGFRRSAPRTAHAACLGCLMNASNVDILLIEDDTRLAELTATYLEQNGLRVATEERGDRALERFARETSAPGAARPAAARQGWPDHLPRAAPRARGADPHPHRQGHRHRPRHRTRSRRRRLRHETRGSHGAAGARARAVAPRRTRPRRPRATASRT